MVSAQSDISFVLPSVRPSYRPAGLTGPGLHRLIALGNGTRFGSCPLLHRILDRIVELRGSNVAWCFGLPVRQVLAPMQSDAGALPALVAPLTIFKIRQGLWSPKVIIKVADNAFGPSADFSQFHTLCRRASVEHMCISRDHFNSGYLDSKDFKRAFNGAFFCEESGNTTIFCPTLRDLGYYSWDQAFSSYRREAHAYCGVTSDARVS